MLICTSPPSRSLAAVALHDHILTTSPCLLYLQCVPPSYILWPQSSTSARILNVLHVNWWKHPKIFSSRVRTNHTRGVYPGRFIRNNFCTFCKAFISVPGSSGSSIRHLYNIPTRTRNFLKFCTSVPQIPGVRVYPFYTLCEVYTPVTQTRNFCVSSVPLPYPTRNF